MEGEKQKRGKSKIGSKREKGEISEDIDGGEEGRRKDGEQGAANEKVADITAFRVDLKSDMDEFRLALREDMRKELNEFREEINQKMKEFSGDLQATTVRVMEMEQRITDTEEWNGAAGDALLDVLEKQREIQAKLIDLDARSRRNNLRIYGIQEGSEGSNPVEFVAGLIKSELGLPLMDMELGIQRCHRALAPKSPRDAPPRSLVLCFLEHRVKEQLFTAWKKKEVRFEGKRIYFDHDYPSEILKRRKAYVGILKKLKSKGIRFQTLHPAKLKVFFENGTQIYENATEAAKDMKKRGFSVENVKDPDSPHWNQQSTASWKRAGADQRRTRVDQERIQEKLQSFQRVSPGSSETDK